MATNKPIGVFDSGYGGLTILKELVKKLPEYDFLYFGDNARTPYGSRSYETVYNYTMECVNWFFKQDCTLVIIACNTASAKALRTIQQNDLVKLKDQKRVLGVIRPTAEIIGTFTKTNCIGVLATTGTVQSDSYKIEINKFSPEINVFQKASPMWVPMVENNEYENLGADFFIKKYIDELLAQSKDIDVILLACTHYPLLLNKIREFTPEHIKILSQGGIVAESLSNYLIAHPEIEELCTKNGQLKFCTSDSTLDFDNHSANFFGKAVKSRHINL